MLNSHHVGAHFRILELIDDVSCNGSRVGQTFTSYDWLENFRMSHATFMYLCNELRSTIEKDDTKAIPAEQTVAQPLFAGEGLAARLSVALTLWFLVYSLLTSQTIRAHSAGTRVNCNSSVYKNGRSGCWSVAKDVVQLLEQLACCPSFPCSPIVIFHFLVLCFQTFYFLIGTAARHACSPVFLALSALLQNYFYS